MRSKGAPGSRDTCTVVQLCLEMGWGSHLCPVGNKGHTLRVAFPCCDRAPDWLLLLGGQVGPFSPCATRWWPSHAQEGSAWRASRVTGLGSLCEVESWPVAGMNVEHLGRQAVMKSQVVSAGEAALKVCVLGHCTTRGAASWPEHYRCKWEGLWVFSGRSRYPAAGNSRGVLRPFPGTVCHTRQETAGLLGGSVRLAEGRGPAARGRSALPSASANCPSAPFPRAPWRGPSCCSCLRQEIALSSV